MRTPLILLEIHVFHNTSTWNDRLDQTYAIQVILFAMEGVKDETVLKPDTHLGRFQQFVQSQSGADALNLFLHLGADEEQAFFRGHGDW